MKVRPAAWVLLSLCAAAGSAVHAAGTAVSEPEQVTPGHALRFPRDLGSHPGFRTEWWYVTGWLTTDRGEPLGFQVTFFRTRPSMDTGNPSAFAPRQLLVAHCAISDPAHGHLWQDQRIRRAGLGLADALESDTQVWIDDWQLRRSAAAYHASITATDFALDLWLQSTQPPMLNGDAGFSRKGSAPSSASEYYSEPHLAVSGRIVRAQQAVGVSGEAWLDHEWSSNYLEPGAAGWDWVGLNLEDGGAVMAFRIRDRQGRALWAGATVRDAAGRARSLPLPDVHFVAGRRWRSSRTGVVYPVSWRLQVGEHLYDIEPLMDDQENDARASSGTLYWEGAVRAQDGGRPVGRGYLELTGYGEPLQLR